MKLRNNPTAHGMKAVDVAARFRYRRATRRRARLEDGVIRIRFIKTLPPSAPVAALPEPVPEAPHCFVFDCPENAFYLTDGIAHCWRHRGKAEREVEAERQQAESAEEWARSLTPPSPPWDAANPPTTVCINCHKTVPWPGFDHLRACLEGNTEPGGAA